MDRTAQITPATDLLVQATPRHRHRAAADEFKTLLETAVNGKPEKHPKHAVDRPETDSPEKQAIRKQRQQKSADTEPVHVQQQEPPGEPVLTDAAQAMAQQTAIPQPAPQQAAATLVPPIPAAAQQQTVAVPADAAPAIEALAAEATTAPEQPAVPAAETAPADPRQQKFDSMLQKAAQELESAKQQPATESTPSDAAPEAAEPEATEPEAAQPVPAEEAEAPKQPELQARANVQQNAHAQVQEQKPLTAIPEEDRAMLGLVQTASAPPPAPEAPPEPAAVNRPAPVPQPMRMPDQTERIRAAVVQNLKQKRTEFTMRLEPETLGKIDVKMILEGGKLAVQITAASQKTAELLQRQTEQLASSLRLGNANLESIQVTSAQEASSHMEGQFGLESGQNRQTQQEGHSGGKNPGEARQEGEQQPEAHLPGQMLDYEI